MLIPEVTHARQFDETHAALYKPAGKQTLSAVNLGRLGELLRCFRCRWQPDQDVRQSPD